MSAARPCSCTLCVPHSGSLTSRSCLLQFACAEPGTSMGAFDPLQPIYIDTKFSQRYIQQALPPGVDPSVLPSAGQPGFSLLAHRWISRLFPPNLYVYQVYLPVYGRNHSEKYIEQEVICLFGIGEILQACSCKSTAFRSLC